MVLGTAGLGVSLVMLYVHYQLAASGGEYSSFCNINQGVNCDVVLTSSYAKFLGMPVALWAVGTYLAFIVLARIPGSGAAIAMAALAGFGIGFSVFLAAVSVAVLHTVCLLCATLYVVNAGLLIFAITHAAQVAGGGRTAAAVLVPMALATVVGYGASRIGGGPGAIDSEFYHWYAALPVIPGTADVPSGPVHSRGRDDARVTIVEFSDFACKHCASAHTAIKGVLARHPDDVRVIFRHFPLDTACNPALEKQVHPSACQAAMAAECAGNQGRFWEYHDYLFENAQPWDWLVGARGMGLDVDAFRQCLLEELPLETVERDVKRGVELGVTSTPTCYINGRVIAGTLEAPYYEHAIAIEIGGAGDEAAVLH
jgi:protein-disulfide isomerase/uncharacterized membrane protein